MRKRGNVFMAMALMAALSAAAAAEEPVLVAKLTNKPRRSTPAPRLVAAAGERLLVMWIDGKELRAAASRDTGKNWTGIDGAGGPTTLAESVMGDFDAGIGHDGQAHVVWAERSSIRLVKLAAKAEGWAVSKPTIIDGGFGLRNPTVCIDGSDRVWAAYHFSGHNAMTGVRVSAIGKQPEKFNITYGFGGSIQHLVVWKERPVLFYSGASNHESVQIYWTAFDGKRWPPARTGIGACSRSPGAFAIATDRAGRPHVAWLNFIGRAIKIWHRRLGKDGKWGPAGKYGRPAFTLASGHLLCLYARSDADKLTIRRWQGDAWTAPQTLTVSGLKGRFSVPPQVQDGEHLPIAWAGETGRDAAVLFTTVSLGKAQGK